MAHYHCVLWAHDCQAADSRRGGGRIRDCSDSRLTTALTACLRIADQKLIFRESLMPAAPPEATVKSPNSLFASESLSHLLTGQALLWPCECRKEMKVLYVTSVQHMLFVFSASHQRCLFFGLGAFSAFRVWAGIPLYSVSVFWKWRPP